MSSSFGEPQDTTPGVKPRQPVATFLADGFRVTQCLDTDGRSESAWFSKFRDGDRGALWVRSGDYAERAADARDAAHAVELLASARGAA